MAVPDSPPMVSVVAEGESDTVPPVGSLLADKYLVDDVIGEGGMGVVLGATNRLTGRKVALKWIRPLFGATNYLVARFEREARAAARIDHPNVVEVYDIGEHGGARFLVMPRLRGQTLGALLEQEAPLTPAAALAILIPAMRGVDAAHVEGIVHRDLKPDNIFLCEGPDGRPREPKVLDFGVSKLLTPEMRTRLTASGVALGTPSYMAPEQMGGAKEADARADVYSLGVILYEAITGHLPYEGETLGQLMIEIESRGPTPPRDIDSQLPPALSEVVLRALAREPEGRFEDVRSFARALEPFAGGVRLGVTGPRGRIGARTQDLADALVPGRWRSLAPMFGAVVLFGLGAWLVVRAASGGEAPAPPPAPPASAPAPPASAPAPPASASAPPASAPAPPASAPALPASAGPALEPPPSATAIPEAVVAEVPTRPVPTSDAGARSGAPRVAAAKAPADHAPAHRRVPAGARVWREPVEPTPTAPSPASSPTAPAPSPHLRTAPLSPEEF